MQNTLKQLMIVVSISALGAFAADNTLGTWKLNMEKSKFNPSAPVKNLMTTREAWENGVKSHTTGERADGTAIDANYSAKYDGKEYDVTGAPYDTIAIKQAGPNTLTFTQKKKDGKYNVSGRTVVSKSGKTMTNTLKGTNADGQPYLATMVWEKQ